MLRKLRHGLQKTRDALKEKLDLIFNGSEINQDFYDELEETLLTADVGVDTTLKIINTLREKLKAEKIRDTLSAREALNALLIEIMNSDEKSHQLNYASHPPTVFLILGVNGVGKTTTIAKMAHYFVSQGKKVLLAAGDTFRAAAIEQLEEWSSRVGADIVKHHPGGDPSAVIYDAVNASIARKVDVLLCDTAGRLHTKVNLLEEMKKIYRTISKALEGAPHETLLVLDATTGHNGVAQAKLFQKAIPLTGIILTKLDGTARGGIVVAIKDITGIPVKLVGVGEKKEDLHPFSASEFVEALLH